MKKFIIYIRDAHAKVVKNEKSQTLVAICNGLLKDLETKVNAAIEICKTRQRLSITQIVKSNKN